MQFGIIKNILFVLPVAVLAVVFAGFVSSKTAHAQVTPTITPCTFTGNLELGTVNGEVLCLQKFLNQNGFKIADIGPGSPGAETSKLGSLTQEAIKRWQSSNGVTPTGTFGPLSKQAYLKQVAALLTAQVAGLGATSVNTQVTNPIVSVADPESGKEQDAKEAIRNARDDREKAQNDLDDANSSDINIEDAQKDIDDSEDDLIKAVYAFIDEDYDKAISRAQDVSDSMKDILDKLHGDDSDAQNALDDAQNAYDDAKNEINRASDRGDHVDAAIDLLDKSKAKLKLANRAFKDEDFNKAEDYANEAEDFANDAVDAID